MWIGAKWGRPVWLGGLSVVLALWAQPAASQSVTTSEGGSGRERIPVERAAVSIDVDARLDEAAWSGAVAIPLPYETLPGDNTPAPVETACRVTYDEANLYFGCEAADPNPSRIRAFITDRDDIRDHDWVGIAIDPFNDARRAFQFAVSALGVQRDALFDEAQGWDESWDAIWESSGRITETGYVVEAAIPFKSLRFPSRNGAQTWGFFAIRVRPRSDRVEMQSMYWDRGQSCRLCQANLLTGIQDVSPTVNLEFTPTMTSSRTDRRPEFPGGAVETGPVEAEAGLDLRWGITSDLTLNGTVNPDFSQVEADVAQLDVNRRFALFFPERRPFFQEGSDLFSTPLQAVFTRTIVDPSFGTKLTGKSGASALGAIVARDEVNSLLFPGNQGSSGASLDEGVTTVLARYRRDVGTSSALGALFTDREGDGYYNRVVGADAFLRPFGALTVRAQLLHSETDYRDDVARTHGQRTDAFGGNAAQINMRYRTRDWFGNVNFRYLEPEFRADAGFITQVDVRGANGMAERSFWGDDAGWFTRFILAGGFWHNENFDGRLTNQGLWLNAQYEGPLQSRFWLNPNLSRDWFAGETFELKSLWTGFNLRPSGSFGINLWGNVGEAIDFANAAKGFQIQANPSIDLRIGRRIDLRLSQRFQRLSRDGEEVFTAGISELRAVYNFSPRAFIRGTFQLRDTDRNPALHEARVDREREALFSQLLFSYKLNPQSVLFIGYSDNRAGSTGEDFSRVPLTQRDRTFFMKLGYAWRP